MKKRTKIVCTIGPACESREILTQMVKAGMNVARLNFSHGTYENHAMLIENIRAVATETGEPVAIMQDLQGPKIRVGLLPEAGVVLTEGQTVVFDTSIKQYDQEHVPIDYSELHTFLQPQERILLADGKIEVVITAVDGTKITTTVVVGGTIFSHKGINIPDSTLTIRALT
ncbi:MAG: pyruvate kinase, partial [Candidatus Magasanikbacteria bacterium CG10_big_fil_rev_8_21_14_0_10_43_6]